MFEKYLQMLHEPCVYINKGDIYTENNWNGIKMF